MDSTESDFSFSELFFSHTDRRGYIVSGNTVFQRISEFEWEDLLNHPHNVIRHADMPRGVFHLFWKKLLTDKPIGAFVKNRSKSGKYYWVFALAVPVEEGFLSIRMKPTGRLFQIIKEKYKKLQTNERQNKLSPEASQEMLLADLLELGFPDYETFMIEAFLECIQEREKELNRPLITALINLQSLQEFASSITEKANKALNAYKETAFVPLNLEIHTNQIGADAAPLAVVAAKYDSIAKEVQEGMQGFNRSSKIVFEKVIKSKFDICSAVLQDEMFHYFQTENGDYSFDVGTEMNTLKSLRLNSLKNSIQSLKGIEDELRRFKKSCDDLKTLSMGLEIIRLMGRIEIVKLEGQVIELEAMIGILHQFRELLSTELRSIEDLGQKLNRLTASLISDPFFSDITEKTG